MAARFTEPTEAEIVALVEKATPENTKKQLNMEYIINNYSALSRRNELIANSALRTSLATGSCTTRARGIIVNYHKYIPYVVTISIYHFYIPYAYITSLCCKLMQ